MSPDWNWQGARWWRCDLHLHTPASSDFSDQSVTADDWVAAARAARLDAVAVTDHNTGEFINAVQEAVHRDGHGPVVFPGVEITVYPGLHLLFLLPTDQGRDAVNALLDRCEIKSENDCSRLSAPEAMKRAEEKGAVCIAAHVDGKRGLLRVVEPGIPLQQIITSAHLHGVEVKDVDSERLTYLDNTKEGYRRPFGRLATLTFSDAHALDQIGRRPTWIKMTRPSLDGIRLALRDGELSIRPHPQDAADPNTPPPLAVESIEVRKARYMGRGEPFKLNLNPWLNAIIGGRGTGKSSLIEFLRTAMRRQDELRGSLRQEFDKQIQVSTTRHDSGLLTPDTEVIVTYRKHGARFRIQWHPRAELDAIRQEEPGGTWTVAEGEVKQRFLIRIYSQKQIFGLAQDPGALLDIVDEAQDVDFPDWERQWQQEKLRFLALRAEAREIEAQLNAKSTIKAELEDGKRKLKIFEEAGHADVLKLFHRRRRQRNALSKWEQNLSQTGDRVHKAAADVTMEDLDPELFQPADDADREIIDAAASVSRKLGSIREELTHLGAKAEGVSEHWQTVVAESGWQKAVDRSARDHERLLARLREEGAGNPDEYGSLVQQCQALEDDLRKLTQRRRNLESIEKEVATRLEQLGRLRRKLSERRKGFLDGILTSNPHVRIELLPYGGTETVEEEFRKLINKEDGAFGNDVGTGLDETGILGKLYQGYLAALDKAGDEAERHQVVAEFELRLQRTKRDIVAMTRKAATVPEVQDQRFAKHMRKLRPADLAEIECWYPRDSLRVSYSPTADGRHFRPIEQGSPGQKTAALLAFLLSYGEEPIVLDQPEDDLDNQLIYDLIVRQLRQIKLHRQVLIVTHDANVVVNGDAELVTSFKAAGGQTQKGCEGGLQEPSVREEICTILEGGREAFERRYQWIALGDGNV